MIETKSWGFKAFLDDADGVRVERLFVAPGGYCSIHRHARVDHDFDLEWGRLFVERFDDQEGCPCSAKWLRGDNASCHVPSGVIHRFRAGPEGAVVVERSFGWSEGDIERFTEGGIG